LSKIDREVRAEIIEHMNSDHPDAVLAYLHHFAGLREAESAQIIDVNDTSMLIERDHGDGTTPNKDNLVEVALSEPISNIKDAERVMVMMFFEARAALATQEP
tara:strand:- start:198 stop:506 length:309 start_codon:yes stop_codon:yes gene_type:complete